MGNTNELTPEVNVNEGGKIVFAADVIATIAGLAAADVKGVAGMSGGMVEGFTELLGKKNLTKGIKVEVGSEEAAVDVNLVVQYGFKIQEVCANVQNAIRNAIETMTGLRVVEVNVFVQAINFENPERKAEEKAEKDAAKEAAKAEKEAAKAAEKAEKAAKEQPRVK